MKKTLISTLIALAFGCGSSLALANPNNNKQDNEGLALQLQDNSVYTTQSGSGPKANEYSSATDNSTEVENSAIATGTSSAQRGGTDATQANNGGNAAADNDGSAVAQTHSSAQQGNNSFNDSSTTVGDIGIAISASVLTGTVTGNSATNGAGSVFYTGFNEITGGAGSNGINQLSQNTGNNALVQQSVSVQANLNF